MISINKTLTSLLNCNARLFLRSFAMLSRISTIVLLAAAALSSTANLHAVVIDPVSATASSFYAPDDRSAIHTIDNSGMTAAVPWEMAGTSPSNAMWLSNDTQTATITWDLGAVYSLTDTHMWNYNETNANGNPYWLRGVQTADVKISTDGVTYTDLGTKTFLVSPGSPTYTGADYSFLNFKDARYVQFNVLSSFGGTGSGDNYTGISEIRFVGTLTPEPGSFVLCGLGAVGLFFAARRRRG
jgi:hypothetical protein